MSSPAVPEPDVKDWTWVITEACPECGFDPAAGTRADVPARTTAYAAVVREAALRPGADVRPDPTTWSALEYACHVRDVCELFGQRLELMLTHDDAEFANWNQDDTALAGRYWTQDPARVAAELDQRAASIAAAFAAVTGDQWQRTGRRSNGSVFTVDTFAAYFLHDLAHHAWDVAVEGTP